MTQPTTGPQSKTGKAMRSPWIVYALLVAASLAYCPRLFSGLDQWGRGDWDQFTFRYAAPRRAMLVDGQLPLWNPYVNGGNVLLAHPHCPAFSPWYLPTLLFGAPLGLRLQVVLMMAVGAVGMAALLRRWEVGSGGCFIGGVLLMMSAHFAMHVAEGHLEWCLLALMPWVLLCLLRARDDWRFAVVGGLVFATALLHGSIYISVIFAPLFGVWAAAEGVRTRSWRPAAGWAAAMGLALLLCAVVLLPRIEFLSAHPRSTELREEVTPGAIWRMLADPRQASMFRATRDQRNPPQAELSRLLPSAFPSLAKRRRTAQWYRLDVTLSTTSDWTDVQLEGFPYVMYLGDPATVNKSPGELDLVPLGTEGLSLSNPVPQGETSTDRPEVSQQATVYARLPKRGDLRFIITRGGIGATRLTVRRADRVLLDANHDTRIGYDGKNRLEVAVTRRTLMRSDRPEHRTADPWYKAEVTVRTTSDWCDVRVADVPYLFIVEQPYLQQQSKVPFSASSLAVDNRSGKGQEQTVRAILCFRDSARDNLRLVLTQGFVGTSSVQLRTLEGELLEGTWTDVTRPLEETTFEYALARDVIRGRLPAIATPWRWRLDEMGMTYDWHEYGCYATWLGLILALLGAVVSFRRQWPLLLTAAVAGAVVLGAMLPIDLWYMWKQLPMYRSLQVPSRLLVVVVFVMAACAGFGLDRLGRWTEQIGGAWLRRLAVCGAAAAIYVELAILGWNLFSDVFVCPPQPVPTHEQFAQRYAADDVRYAAMYSAHTPYLHGNSGVLREYENIAVPRGKIRLEGQPDYRLEAYLDQSHGTAKIVDWSMSRVKIALEVDAADRLVLNQNFFSGWRAIRRGRDATAENSLAERSSDGLVSIGVRPGDREVEFYYRPPGLICGAVISVATLLLCVGLLVAGRRPWTSWRSTRFALLTARRFRPIVQSRAFGWIVLLLVLNAPFLLCHPGRPMIDVPLIRSLAVGAVLFIVPGLPLVGRGWLRRFYLLWTVAASFAVFLAMLLLAYATGRPCTSVFTWNGTWIATNAAIAAALLARSPLDRMVARGDRHVWTGVLAFALTYLLLLHGATRVVPPMEDLDYEAQGTAPSLLARFEPRLLTDRNTTYYFAHPPLLHFYMAGSFLYLDQLHHLEIFDAAWDRAHRAGAGESVDAPVTEFYHRTNNRLTRQPEPGEEGATRHRIVGQEGAEYVIDPPLPQRGDRIGVQAFETQMLYDHYRHHPRRLATRSPNVFLAALAVGLLAWWIGRMTGRWWLAGLIAMAFTTSPEMFVRSVYGGYTALNNFLLLQILLLAEDWTARRDRQAWAGCFLAGALAGLANQKLIPLAAALVVWEVLRLPRRSWPREALRAVLHPVAVGFVGGTAIFWAWGLAVDADVFYLEQVRHHLVDRVIHSNPLGYGNYPTVPGLWLELCGHTGWLLLPLGVVALGLLCRARAAPLDGAEADAGKGTRGWRDAPGLWAIWAVATALAFSLIDWRQTKHLMPVLIPLHLAPARWAATGRVALAIVGVVFAGLLLWNLDALQMLATDFASFTITPAW